MSIWTTDLPLLDIIWELANELAADWFIGWEVGELASRNFSPSEANMGMSLL